MPTDAYWTDRARELAHTGGTQFWYDPSGFWGVRSVQRGSSLPIDQDETYREDAYFMKDDDDPSGPPEWLKQELQRHAWPEPHIFLDGVPSSSGVSAGRESAEVSVAHARETADGQDTLPYLDFNTKLAKQFQRLKKDAGATMVSQNYRGTGSEAARRQLWVRFKSGAVIDLWLENGHVKFGGVVMNSPPGSSKTPLVKRDVAYDDKTPEQVYAEAVGVLGPWANQAASVGTHASEDLRSTSGLITWEHEKNAQPGVLWGHGGDDREYSISQRDGRWHLFVSGLELRKEFQRESERGHSHEFSSRAAAISEAERHERHFVPIIAHGSIAKEAGAEMSTRTEIVDAIARTLYVTAWADREEERGRKLPRGDLMQLAPPTSKRAASAAIELATAIEHANKKSLDALYADAAAMPGKHYREPTPYDFGYTLAMEALGHGVSWEDDHPKTNIVVPEYEYYSGKPLANEGAAQADSGFANHHGYYIVDIRPVDDNQGAVEGPFWLVDDADDALAAKYNKREYQVIDGRFLIDRAFQQSRSVKRAPPRGGVGPKSAREEAYAADFDTTEDALRYARAKGWTHSDTPSPDGFRVYRMHHTPNSGYLWQRVYFEKGKLHFNADLRAGDGDLPERAKPISDFYASASEASPDQHIIEFDSTTECVQHAMKSGATHYYFESRTDTTYLFFPEPFVEGKYRRERVVGRLGKFHVTHGDTPAVDLPGEVAPLNNTAYANWPAKATRGAKTMSAGEVPVIYEEAGEAGAVSVGRYIKWSRADDESHLVGHGSITGARYTIEPEYSRGHGKPIGFSLFRSDARKQHQLLKSSKAVDDRLLAIADDLEAKSAGQPAHRSYEASEAGRARVAVPSISPEAQTIPIPPKPLKWHRDKKPGRMRAEGRVGVFIVAKQKPDRRHGIFPYLVVLNDRPIGSFNDLTEAKMYAEHYDRIMHAQVAAPASPGAMPESVARWSRAPDAPQTVPDAGTMPSPADAKPGRTRTKLPPLKWHRSKKAGWIYAEVVLAVDDVKHKVTDSRTYLIHQQKPDRRNGVLPVVLSVAAHGMKPTEAPQFKMFDSVGQAKKFAEKHNRSTTSSPAAAEAPDTEGGPPRGGPPPNVKGGLPPSGAAAHSPTSTSTEVRSPTSTSTEVRSPTSTSTEVRSPTSTSTDAFTSGNVTVTGGAGAGATTSVTIVQTDKAEPQRKNTPLPRVERATDGRMWDMVMAPTTPPSPERATNGKMWDMVMAPTTPPSATRAMLPQGQLAEEGRSSAGPNEVPWIWPEGTAHKDACFPWMKPDGTKDADRFDVCMKLAHKIGPLTNARKLFDFAGPALLRSDQEQFVVVSADIHGMPRAAKVIAIGQRSRVGVGVVDVLRAVLLAGGEMYGVLHVHPAGGQKASAADMRLTKGLAKATKDSFGSEVAFVDHVIVTGKNTFYSCVERKAYRVSATGATEEA